MCNIANCIFTHNHPETVRDVLSKCINDYSKLGIDMYYFDSSKDDKTEKIIREYQNIGYKNLYYVKFEEDKTLIQKIASFFEGNGLIKEYDYFWPIKDRSYVPKATLEKIISETKKKCDLIFLGVVSNGRGIENKVYNDEKIFYKEWGWLATSLDVTIYNKNTMLVNFSKRNLSEIYQDEYIQHWYVFVTMFNILAEMKNVNISLLCDAEIKIYNSPLAKSEWESNVFKIWKNCWIEANDNLPACYNEYKDSVIKYAASLPWILGGIPRLIELHQKGILTEENYDDIIQNWERVSDIPRETVKEIACGTYGTYDKFHDVSSIKNVQSEVAVLLIQLIKFLKAGKMGKEQIPFDNIFKCIQGEIISKNKYSAEIMNTVIGSVNDVINYAKQENTDINGVIKSIQILVIFVLLSN